MISLPLISLLLLVPKRRKEGRVRALLPYLQNRSVYGVKLDCLVIDLCSWLDMGILVWLQSPMTIIWFLSQDEKPPDCIQKVRGCTHLFPSQCLYSFSTLIPSIHPSTHPSYTCSTGPLTTEEERSYQQFNPHLLAQSLESHVLQSCWQAGVLRTQHRKTDVGHFSFPNLCCSLTCGLHHTLALG